MDVKYGNRKVPSKILKSVEEKASRAATVTNLTARTESKKRKTAGVPNALAKRRREARVPKAASAGSGEEEAEAASAGMDEDAHAGAEIAQMETSATGRDTDLMASTLQGLGGDAALGAPDIEPMPSISGPGADASSSEDEDAVTGESTVSSGADTASKGCTRSAKASCLEESDAEYEDRVPLARSLHAVDTDIADAIQDIMGLGKNLLATFSFCCVLFLSFALLGEKLFVVWERWR